MAPRMQARGWRGKPSDASCSRMDWISPARWMAFVAEETCAHRVASGKDGWADRYGDWILWSGGKPPRVDMLGDELSARYGFAPRGYLARELVRKATDQKPAVLIAGEEPGEISVRENGLFYLVEPAGGYSSGLFLDQRLNRQWVRELGAKRMLNLFAYTCSFTVCAASSGAETCSVDASKRVLATGRRNLELNGIAPSAGHRFLADDALKVVPRLQRRGETFDLVVLDPPTFGRADGRVFRIERDLPALVGDCFRLLEPGGWLLVSTNYAGWSAGDLRDLCRSSAGRNASRFEPCASPPEIEGGAVAWRLRKER
jgi:23S rRNA (cytosine1962-C5)-methyltransferase